MYKWYYNSNLRDTRCIINFCCTTLWPETEAAELQRGGWCNLGDFIWAWADKTEETKINQRKENELERKRTCLCLSGGRDHSRLTLHLRLNLHPTCCCLNACTYTVYILKFKSSTHLENCCRGTLSLSLMARDSLMCLFLSFAWCLTRTLNPGF